jgi:hypothetical protein
MISMDGSGGQCGDHPELTISIHVVNHPGTAKTSLQCYLLKQRMRVSSKLEQFGWQCCICIFSVWKGKGRRGLSILTINSKGGSDSRVLYQVLIGYAVHMFPDSADVPRKWAIFK